MVPLVKTYFFLTKEIGLSKTLPQKKKRGDGFKQIYVVYID